LGNMFVHERSLLEKWGTHRGRAGFDVSSAEREGKAGPLETGGGKYSPPARPERVTSQVLNEGTIVFLSQIIPPELAADSASRQSGR
jgi:hypothetical protein